MESRLVKEFTKKRTEDGRPYHEGAKPKWIVSWVACEKYQPGTLTAIARDENGNEIARDSVTTAGSQQEFVWLKKGMLSLQMEKDLSTSIMKLLMAMVMWFLQLTILFIQSSWSGDKSLVWIMENKLVVKRRYKAQADGTWQRRAFNGKRVVIVKSTEKEKEVELPLYADSAGLTSDSTTVTTVSGRRKSSLSLYSCKSNNWCDDKS